VATPYHKTKKESHANYLDWFENSRYQDLDQLEPWKILALLEERVSIFQPLLIFMDKQTKSRKLRKCTDRLTQIQENPLYYQNTEFSELSEAAKQYFRKREKAVSPILPLPEHDGVWTIDQVLSSNFSMQLALEDNFVGKELSDGFSNDNINIDIDLTAPESKIKSDFNELLKTVLNFRNERLKKAKKVSSIPKFAKANPVIEGLINHRVFQYIDILIFLDYLPDEIADSNGKPVKIKTPSDRYIAKTIFQEMDEDEAWDKFREFTKPKAMQILDRNSGYLVRLASAVNN
jgi:hypothetical protein